MDPRVPTEPVIYSNSRRFSDDGQGVRILFDAWIRLSKCSGLF